MNRRPTIIDVARAAGVSKSTVSLVLQNSPTVREETRQQVREAMARIGYVYNRAAANMRMANAGLIGLVINDLRNPFFTEFATSLQMALSARGYSAVVANTDEDPALQAQVVGAMIEHGVSAVILSPTYGGEAETFGALARSGIPAMQVLRKVESRTELFPFAAPDYVQGSRDATEHLIRAGARRIAFVGGFEGRSVTQVRMSGYRSALEQAGLEPVVITGRATRAFGREAAHRLSAEMPEVDAALAFNDLVALGILSGCAEIGRTVGDAFKVVGFDDIEESAHAWPPLSSVRCDVNGFGKGIADTVLNWLEDGKTPPEETLTPVDLVVRRSSGGAGAR
ncbi:LacI family DNA-binding transcriptional regulator [Salipiger mangrovisoli]|uniref:LacI family DNA-binding transcriptional regulator n=1 Tax=Salipiger mangrovisoli TaxID=2865933 RepID=A0ABR9X1S2_9RHOB|nr:LacI family DNA-binding transcriptional regulator [Salipiger mangrovisoli]MBE9637432.1 LacI family DNA-binding transcriptional regulator [Salipiger mangrovisoli]